MGMQGSVTLLEFTNVKTNQVYLAKMLEKSTLAGEDKRKITSEVKFIKLHLRHENIVRYSYHFED
jgi:hypothetical protein